MNRSWERKEINTSNFFQWVGKQHGISGENDFRIRDELHPQKKQKCQRTSENLGILEFSSFYWKTPKCRVFGGTLAFLFLRVELVANAKIVFPRGVMLFPNSLKKVWCVYLFPFSRTVRSNFGFQLKNRIEPPTFQTGALLLQIALVWLNEMLNLVFAGLFGVRNYVSINDNRENFESNE